VDEGPDSARSDPGGDIAAARQLVARSRRVVVLTGAGISTDSGIPDFRGPNGVWTKDPGAERLATLDIYLNDPEVRRRSWQSRRRSGFSAATPNAGHRALVALEQEGRLDTLVTQNIDGLHLDAGHDPDRVIEIHGTVRSVVCMACGDRNPMPTVLARVEAGEADPRCLAGSPPAVCGGILKSATISFGQNLIARDLMAAEDAAGRCDLLLAVGSSLTVYPAAALVPLAKQAGARVVIVNGEPTPFDDLADVVLRGSISEVLPAIVVAGASG
jgi:NAD-dependent deacetylase